MSTGKERREGDFPSRDLYKEHPKAKELRTLVLDIANRVDLLMYDPFLESDKEARIRAEAELQRQQEELRSFDVVPNIHLTRDKTNRFGHPTRIAEDIAGIWLTHLDGPIPTRTMTASVVRDYLRTHSEDEIDDTPPVSGRFLLLNRLVGLTFRVLDAADLLDYTERYIQETSPKGNRIFTWAILQQRRRASIVEI